MAAVEEKLSKLEEYVKDQKSWKEKYEGERDVSKSLEQEILRLKSKLEELKPEEIQKLKKHNKLLDVKVKDLIKHIEDAEQDLKLYDELRSVFRRMFPKGVPAQLGPGFEPGTRPEGPAMSIADVDERINQRLSESKSITVVKVDVTERIKELVKGSYVQNLEAKIRALPAPAVKAALWMHEKKQAKIGDLYYYMYEKAGRIPGNFYANVVKPLENTWLINNEGGNVRWILEEKLSTELMDVLRNGDVQDLVRYLTSLLL